MANTKSAKKRVRTLEKRTVRNKSMRSQYKTYVTKAQKAVESGDPEAAKEAVKQAISVLDKTAQSRVIHPNNAARRKGQLARKLNAVLSQGQ